MREKIRLKDISEGYNTEEFIDDNFEFEQETQVSFDIEKGCIEHEVVFRRISDGTYFKYVFTDRGREYNTMIEQIATQVTRKEKTVYYFE